MRCDCIMTALNPCSTGSYSVRQNGLNCVYDCIACMVPICCYISNAALCDKEEDMILKSFKKRRQAVASDSKIMSTDIAQPAFGMLEDMSARAVEARKRAQHFSQALRVGPLSTASERAKLVRDGGDHPVYVCLRMSGGNKKAYPWHVFGDAHVHDRRRGDAQPVPRRWSFCLRRGIRRP